MSTIQRLVGTSVERSEDNRVLTGTGTYIDDVKLPGMLHATFVRSQMAHARINGIDIEAAQAVPGVHAVITGEALQALLSPTAGTMGLMGASPAQFTVLCTDKVRLVGDPIVLIVADSRYIAEDAAELVDVDYDPLQPIADTATALDPTSEPIFADLGKNVINSPKVNVHGDIDAAFAKADRVIKAKIEQHRHQNVPMECRGCVSDFDPKTGKLLHYGSNQGVGMAKNLLMAQLGLDGDDVRVVCKDIGGSFGLKIGAGREEIAVAAASRLLGRPVKWIEDRNENLSMSGQAREETMEAEMAVTNDGEILGMKVRMVCDTGAYPLGMGGMLGNIVERLMPGPYKMQALQFEYVACVTNKATYVAYRGPWAAETFTRERLIDTAAKELGIDRVEIRRRNLDYQRENPGRMITGATLASCTVRESIDAVADYFDLPAFRKEQEEARKAGRYLGIGFASYIESAPGPRGDNPLGSERMRMKVEADGTVLVFTGQMPHGQSHETTFAQIAADEIGVPFEQVRVIAGDTDLVPMGMTGGSRAATMAGGASLHTARALREKILDVAAHAMEANVADLDIVDGNVQVKGTPARAKTLAEIAAYSSGGALPAELDATLEVDRRYDGGQGGWSGGTHIAIVEVDVETGHVKINRYMVIEDCGKLINPAVVNGQIRGGVVQGIGAVLLERSAYDEDANFLAGSFMDYLLPTLTEVPRIEIHHLETVPLDPDVNFRGVGEGGMIVSPPTLVGAIEDALSPWNLTITEQHLPPLRILELIGALD
ncbi:MAG: xanthine dehydrogenase family protein molybdopterin-binding subunit [Acidimicrobiia bacterium]